MLGFVSSFVSSWSFTAAASERLNTAGWASIIWCRPPSDEALVYSGLGGWGAELGNRTQVNQFRQAPRRNWGFGARGRVTGQRAGLEPWERIGMVTLSGASRASG